MKKKVYKVIDGLEFDVSDDEFTRVTNIQQAIARKNAFFSLIFGVVIYLAPSEWMMVSAATLNVFFLFKAFISAAWLSIYGQIKKRYDKNYPEQNEEQSK